ncbi:FAD-binding oxidoreductase [Candidimonas sp. SYP-B2681]|uniref:FAD-binding oxidoreductase n=1 Tax=Candidimonas sp. SYP-B2681 TaxID=2497686 RepID=UPI001F38774D|nr:FAD-binding oxidoreductase [Candidimonas sp. SYP-B2681]
MVNMSSWGRLSADEHKVVPLVDAATLATQVQQSLPGIAHGMGRSYGDVCLNPQGTVWSTRALDHFIRFDDATGILHCEAGTLLRDIQRLFVPRDWMLPVTPGTQMVTVGGAIANDIHGKNHHVMGSFGDHVHSLRLLRTDGSVIDCAPQEHSDWFAATVGGMGLTGIIVQASIQLRRVAGPWLNTDTVPYANLDEFFQLADESEAGWEHTVSWIDCIGARGRGVFMRANHAPRTDWPRTGAERKLAIPFTPPFP